MRTNYTPPTITLLGAVAELTLASCVVKGVGTTDNALDINGGTNFGTVPCPTRLG